MGSGSSNSSSNARRWWLGCGLGCGLIALGIVAVLATAFFGVKHVVEGFQETRAVMEQVTERYGHAVDFRPDPDGTIRPDRVEAFLRLREIMAPARGEMETSLELISGAERGEGSWSPGRMVRLMRAGTGLVPQIARFYTSRGKAMLEVAMGPGEYDYIYVLAYYTWLGKSPADGPPFRLIGGDDHEDELDEFDVREMRRETVLERVHEFLLPMLRRQLNALDGPGVDERRSDLREALIAEIVAMEADPYRLPWADGLPEPVIRSLQPFRERLEQSYSELCNPLEMGPGG